MTKENLQGALGRIEEALCMSTPNEKFANCDEHMRKKGFSRHGQALQDIQTIREAVPGDMTQSLDHTNIIEGELRTQRDGKMPKSYIMRIPAQPNIDSDFLIDNVIEAATLLHTISGLNGEMEADAKFITKAANIAQKLIDRRG